MDSTPPNSPATPFDDASAYALTDRAKVLLAPMLPGCVARRYDHPIFGSYSPVELCFTDRGPFVAELTIYPSKYNTHAIAGFWYILMLEDPRALGAAFLANVDIRLRARLDSGPEAVAVAAREAIAKVDLAEVVAAGSIQTVCAKERKARAPWSCYSLALCSIYLGRDREASSFLQDCISAAKAHDEPPYAALLAKAENRLSKLNTNADVLREQLASAMTSNWAHFKIV